MSNHPNQHHSAVATPISMGDQRKKVNILAMGSSRSDFDALQLIEQRPDILVGAELWGINYIGAVKRLDRIIHVDPVHPYLGHAPVKDMCDMALKDGIPFYTSWPHPMYINHVIYPYDKVTESLGMHYLNGSVAAAVALAITEGFTDIGLFGCDFSYPQAHLSEAGRANVEFLMGMATQRGVRFAVASSSTLLDMYCGQQPYGFFANPLLPPVNGGKLMTHEEILHHVANFRANGNGRINRPLVYAIAPKTPQVTQQFQDISKPHLEAVPTNHAPLSPVAGASDVERGTEGYHSKVQHLAAVKPKPNGQDISNARDNILLSHPNR